VVLQETPSPAHLGFAEPTETSTLLVTSMVANTSFRKTTVRKSLRGIHVCLKATYTEFPINIIVFHLSFL